MCLATPCKIIKIKNGQAIVKSENHTHNVNLSLVKNAKIGDYLITHGDLALNKISKKDAEEIFKITKLIN